MLSMTDLKVTYGKTTALQMDGQICFDKPVNRIGVIGANGAGKSTLIKALLGLVPYEGKIRMSCPLSDISVQMQQNQYHSDVSVLQVMELILGEKLKRHEKARELIEFFGFWPCLKKRFKQLSGGEKQKFTLILVLARPSRFVILDEVTSGLDFVTRENLMELLTHWFRGTDTDILIVSHYYKEIERIADQILLLDQGRVIDAGDRDRLFQKYCGNALYLTEDTKEAREALQMFQRLEADYDGRLLFRIDTKEEEARLQSALLELQIGYEKSYRNLEAVSQVALKTYKKRTGHADGLSEPGQMERGML